MHTIVRVYDDVEKEPSMEERLRLVEDELARVRQTFGGELVRMRQTFGGELLRMRQAIETLVERSDAGSVLGSTPAARRGLQD